LSDVIASAKPARKEEREIGPKQAIDVAEKHVKENKVDVRGYRIERVTYGPKDKEQYWIITWAREKTR
jgi:hypothetical protein